MPTYAIGDVQGCHQELQDLLGLVGFDAARDRLWFVGDLVNRGPDSLEVLRLAVKIDAVCVLGNHDLHLLAVAAGATRSRRKDTFDDILRAPDCDTLLEWLQNRPLIHEDTNLGYMMVHAGLPPQWDRQLALQLAAEVSDVLRGGDARSLYRHMYGDEPDCWDPSLSGWSRLRFIISACTRMRYVDPEGRLNFRDKGPPGTQSRGYMPWFDIDWRRHQDQRILFGHWASLHQGDPRVYASRKVYPLEVLKR